jgi:hypothetical protein
MWFMFLGSFILAGVSAGMAIMLGNKQTLLPFVWMALALFSLIVGVALPTGGGQAYPYWRAAARQAQAAAPRIPGRAHAVWNSVGGFLWAHALVIAGTILAFLSVYFAVKAWGAEEKLWLLAAFVAATLGALVCFLAAFDSLGRVMAEMARAYKAWTWFAVSCLWLAFVWWHHYEQHYLLFEYGEQWFVGAAVSVVVAFLVAIGLLKPIASWLWAEIAKVYTGKRGRIAQVVVIVVTTITVGFALPGITKHEALEGVRHAETLKQWAEPASLAIFALLFGGGFLYGSFLLYTRKK